MYFCGFLFILRVYLRTFAGFLRTFRFMFFHVYSWNNPKCPFWWWFCPKLQGYTFKFRIAHCWIPQVDIKASACLLLLLKQAHRAGTYWLSSWESNWVKTSCQDSGTWVLSDWRKYLYTWTNSASGHVSPRGSEEKISRSDMLTFTGCFCLRCGSACQLVMIWRRPWPNPTG